jgi:hypothetical protein
MMWNINNFGSHINKPVMIQGLECGDPIAIVLGQHVL